MGSLALGQAQACTRVLMYACAHVRVCSCTRMLMYAYAHVRVCSCTRMLMYACD